MNQDINETNIIKTEVKENPKRSLKLLWYNKLTIGMWYIYILYEISFLFINLSEKEGFVKASFMTNIISII